MMTNLFSMFDPSTSVFNFSLNWTSMFLSLLLVPFSFWLTPSTYLVLYNKILKILFYEFNVIINKKMNSTILIFISLFFFIFFSNFISLFPYIFTTTSHLALNLALALPLWLSFLIFGWLNKTGSMFIHLVPQGTPALLVPFMVCIETISNIIRPITLTIRLTANLIAGHLLLPLMGDMGPTLMMGLIPILIFSQVLLLILEASVAVIQAYVFSVLMTLYYSEI